MRELSRADARIRSLENLSAGDSPVHRLHPGVKIAYTLVFTAAAVSFPSGEPLRLTPFFLLAATGMSLSGTPWKPMLRRLAVTLPFPLMGGLSNLLMNRDVAILIHGFSVTTGMLSFVSILVKSMLCVLAALLLIATTSMNELGNQLLRMKAPAVLVQTLTLITRYIAVLLGEAETMREAYLIRSPGRRAIRMKDMGGMLGSLLLRSLDRAQRVYAAMQCRGSRGAIYRVPMKGLTLRDCLWGAAAAGSAVFFRLFDLSGWLGSLIV